MFKVSLLIKVSKIKVSVFPFPNFDGSKNVFIFGAHNSSSILVYREQLFTTNPVFLKIIGEAFRTEYVCSLASHFRH